MEERKKEKRNVAEVLGSQTHTDHLLLKEEELTEEKYISKASLFIGTQFFSFGVHEGRYQSKISVLKNG